jgi:internalin A
MIKKLISIALLSMISLNSYSESYLFKIKLNNNVVIKDENGNIIENIIPPILTYNYPESTVPSSNWLAFLQDKNNLLSYSNLDEWELMDSGVSLSNHSLNDANLPQETFGISSIYSLNIGHNNFTHIDFLQGITESRSDIIANSNDLTNVNGLSSLISVKTLYLYDNDLKDVNGLRLLTSVDNILMFDNPNLTDITALSNISTVTGFIALDNPTQYTNKPLESSVFCQGISLDNFDVRQSGSSPTLYIGEICDMENDWIDLFHKHNKIINVKSSSLWESTDDVVSFSGISLTDPDLPTEPFGISSIYALNINSTNFTHLDFLQGVTEARTDMYLYNNNLTDISGLKELTTVGNILLFGNPNLTDITALSNISTVTGFIAIDNHTQYINKPLESSAFCQGIINGNIIVKNVTTIINSSQICS